VRIANASSRRNSISYALMQILHRAEQEFEGQPEEVMVLRVSCEMAVTKRDVNAALKRLRSVPSSSPLYATARDAFADITLAYRNDTRTFIAAYLDIVNARKDYDAYVMAGDAFVRVQVCCTNT
jgi:tetratricopeptide repeat protein 21B